MSRDIKLSKGRIVAQVTKKVFDFRVHSFYVERNFSLFSETFVANRAFLARSKKD